MVSVLIVDDHPHLVESLASILPWEELGVSQVYSAYSGYEALETIRRAPVDILITDIRMPGMDGLQLIEQAKALLPGIGCILLTGYAEFEYAKKAIELQTYRYLIKPVRTEEILPCIRELISEKQVRSKRHQEHLHQAYAGLLRQWLEERVPEEEVFTQLVQQHELPFRSGDSFRLAVVRPKHGREWDYTELADRAGIWLWGTSSDYGERMLLMVPSERLTISDWQGSCHQLYVALTKMEGDELPLFISKEGTLPGELQAVYRSALTMARRLYPFQTSVTFQERVSGQERKIDPLFALYEMPTLQHLVENHNISALQDKIQRIFTELHEHWPYSLEHLRETMHHLQSAFTFMAHRKGLMLEELVGTVPWSERSGLLQSSTVLEQWALHLLESLTSDMDTGKREGHQRLIEAVQSYVLQHVGGDVTLTAIAQHVYLHPVYLSKIYKEMTGTNLSDYIFAARMDLAKSLLQNPTLKIYEIGERVGYRSPQHFISEFKKAVGMTPKQYRDL